MTEVELVEEDEGWGDWVLGRRAVEWVGMDEGWGDFALGRCIGEVEYVGEDEGWSVGALGKTVGFKEVAEDEVCTLGRRGVVQIGKDGGLLGQWSTAGR